MFGMFDRGRSASPSPTTPPSDPVIGPATSCCEHCRLRPVKSRDRQLSEARIAPAPRIRFDDAFEADGVRLQQSERESAERLSALNGEVARLEGLNRSLLRLAEWDRRSAASDLLSRLASCERDLKIARGQQAYGLRSWERARSALNEHRRERRAREQQLARRQIAERDRKREAAREAAGLPPPEQEIEVFTIKAPHLLARLLRGAAVAG